MVTVCVPYHHNDSEKLPTKADRDCWSVVGAADMPAKKYFITITKPNSGQREKRKVGSSGPGPRGDRVHNQEPPSAILTQLSCGHEKEMCGSGDQVCCTVNEYG